MRDKGLVPSSDVIITFNWKIGRLFTRIVIPANKPIKSLYFNYLTGLSVMIAHSFNDAHMLPDLINEVLQVNPRILATFNYMLAKQNVTDNPAFYLVHSTRELT